MIPHSSSMTFALHAWNQCGSDLVMVLHWFLPSFFGWLKPRRNETTNTGKNRWSNSEQSKIAAVPAPIAFFPSTTFLLSSATRSPCAYQPGQDPSRFTGPDRNWNNSSHVPNKRGNLKFFRFMSCSFGTIARKWSSGLLLCPWLSLYSLNFFWSFGKDCAMRSLEPGSSAATAKSSLRPGFSATMASSTKISLIVCFKQEFCKTPVGTVPVATALRSSCSSQRKQPPNFAARTGKESGDEARLSTTTRWPACLRADKPQATDKKSLLLLTKGWAT